MKRTKMITFISAILAVSVILGGCGGSSHSSKAAAAAAPEYDDYEEYEGAAESAYYADDYYDSDMVTEQAKSSMDNAEEPAEVTEADVEGGANAQKSQRMLIKNVYLNVESEDVEAMMHNVEKRVDQLGGYVESTNMDNTKYSNSERKTATIVARVPVEKLDSFVDEVEGQSNVLSKNSNAEDVTLKYVDMQSKLESYQTEYDRISELLKEADDLDTIIALEGRLTEIRYQIESYGSQLKVMKNQATYSTITLNITQVIEYTPVTVEEKTRFERMCDGFVSNCKRVWNGILDFFVGLVIALPVLIIWAIIIAAIVLIIKAIIRKHSNGRPKKEKVKRGAKREQRSAVQNASNDQTNNTAQTQDTQSKPENGDGANG